MFQYSINGKILYFFPYKIFRGIYNCLWIVLICSLNEHPGMCLMNHFESYF